MTEVQNKCLAPSRFNLFQWFWPTNAKICAESEQNLISKGLNLESSENAILKYVPVVKGNINTLFIPKTKCDNKEKNLVLTHGFGVGLAIYFRNFDYLSKHNPTYNIYAIDWLGMGRSSRPPFSLHKNKGQTKEEHLKESEDFFVDSLEQWRQEQKIEKMVLLGHSLGGYLSSVYAMKYPERVEKLILASPVGIPTNPNKEENTLENVLKAGEELKDMDNPLPAPNSEFGNKPRKIPGWVSYFWNNHYSPQSIVRFFGPYGPTLVGKYVFRRFAHLEEETQLTLRDYIFHISSMTGSGEYAFGTILEPGAFARNPLINRLPEGLKTPTTFIYGDKDWMDYRHALKLSKMLNVKNSVVRLKDAGHQLFIENPHDFNKLVTDIINDLPFDTVVE